MQNKPETRDDLKNMMKPLLRKAAKLILKPQPVIPDGTELQSHFGGQPYFEKGEQWPQTKNGNNLVFVFQVFNDGNAALPGNVKLIQFYYDFDTWKHSWSTKDKGWLVKVYETLNKENMTLIKKPDQYFHRWIKNPDEKEPWNWVRYCGIEYEQILSLPDWQWIWNVDENIAETLDKSGIEYEDIVEELTGYETEFFSQLGGYPQWIQSGIKKKNNFDFLFQLDSERDAGLMWSDCGMVYVFYNSKTKEVIFELECY